MNGKSLADKLLDLREGKELTQVEVAQKLGVSNRTVSAWEVGDRVPKVSTLIELAEIYGVTLEYLLDKPICQKEINEEIADDLDFKVQCLSGEEEADLKKVKNALIINSIDMIGLVFVLLNCVPLVDINFTKGIVVMSVIVLLLIIAIVRFIQLLKALIMLC